ncbi:MAG: hypothetical protein ACFFCS_03480 [Candidatus Hodarchaeota archaeon]
MMNDVQIPAKSDRYVRVAERIIDRVIELKTDKSRLAHISSKSKYVSKLPDCYRIELRHQHGARGVPHKEYYLILDLSFYIGKTDGLHMIGKKMEYRLSIGGKGNEELKAKIETIIQEEKERFEKR